MLIAAKFKIAKIWNQSIFPSTDSWVRKTWYINTMDYYSAIKRMQSYLLKLNGSI